MGRLDAGLEFPHRRITEIHLGLWREAQWVVASQDDSREAVDVIQGKRIGPHRGYSRKPVRRIRIAAVGLEGAQGRYSVRVHRSTLKKRAIDFSPSTIWASNMSPKSGSDRPRILRAFARGEEKVRTITASDPALLRIRCVRGGHIRPAGDPTCLLC